MYCPNCQQDVGGFKFCPECGAKLEAQFAMPVSPPPTQTQIQVVPPAMHSPSNSSCEVAEKKGIARKKNIIIIAVAVFVGLLILLLMALDENSGSDPNTQSTASTTAQTTTIHFAHDESMSEKERESLHKKLLEPCYKFAKKYASDFLYGTELTPEFYNRLKKDLLGLSASTDDLFNQYSSSQIFVVGVMQSNPDLTIARCFIVDYIRQYYNDFSSRPSSAWGSIRRELFVKPLFAMLDYYGYDMSAFYNYMDELYVESMARFQKILSSYN